MKAILLRARRSEPLRFLALVGTSAVVAFATATWASSSGERVERFVPVSAQQPAPAGRAVDSRSGSAPWVQRPYEPQSAR